MATNIADLFKNSFGESIVREYSGLLGESAQSISSSLDTIVPALIGTMTIKANKDQGAGSLLDFITAAGLTEFTINTSGSEDLMAKGSGVLNYLAGNQLSPLIDSVSSAGGLKTSSSSALLKIVAPLLMGFFGRMVKERSLNAAEAKDLLNAQSEFVKAGTPQDLADMIGFSGKTSASASSNQDVINSNPPKGMSKLLPWIILMITSLGLLYFLEKGCNNPVPMEKVPETETRDTI